MLKMWLELLRCITHRQVYSAEQQFQGPRAPQDKQISCNSRYYLWSILPGTTPQQQIHQANDESKELSILQAGFSQLGVELNENFSSMPYFPLSIASNEINLNEVKPITISSPVTAVEKVELVESMESLKFMGQNTAENARMSNKHSFALFCQFIPPFIMNTVLRLVRFSSSNVVKSLALTCLRLS